MRWRRCPPAWKVCGAGVPRSAAPPTTSSSLHQGLGPRAHRNASLPRSRRIPAATTVRRCLKSRQEQTRCRARRPPAAVRHRQTASGLRQLVQSDPGEVLTLARPQRAVERAGTPSSRTCRGRTTRSDADTKAEIEGLICEHSQIFCDSRSASTDLTEEERARFNPVRQSSCAGNPTRAASRSISRRTAYDPWWPLLAAPPPRDLIEHATHREFVYPTMAGPATGHVGQRQTITAPRRSRRTSRATCAADAMVKGRRQRKAPPSHTAATPIDFDQKVGWNRLLPRSSARRELAREGLAGPRHQGESSIFVM